MLEQPELEWSALMLDANGRLIKPGFLSGTITDFGDYDQCLAIDYQQTENQRIQGKYCLMTIRPPLPPPEIKLNFSTTSYANHWPTKWFGDPRYRYYYRLVTALCFPSDCDRLEIESLTKKVFEFLDFDLTIQVEACQTYQEERQRPLDFAQKFSITVLSISVLAVFIGTLVDWFSNYLPCQQKKPSSDSTWVEFWKSFSLIRNTELLFSITNQEQITGTANSEEKQTSTSVAELTPVHGMRFLLIMWVITCHTTNFAPLGLYDQPMIASRFAERIQIVRELWTQFVISGSLSVQAFFIISGLISLHTALKNRSTFLQSVPYWKFILLRWLRFAPPLLGMFCYQFLWPLLGSGPMMHWDYLRYGHKPCYQSWWANFLFISNWFKLVDQCGSHTWFLSADFQINAMFAYFLIWLYVRQYQTAIWLNVISLIIATITPTIIHLYYQVPLVHILEPDVEKLNIAFNMIEFNTYNHFPAYLSGLLVAAMLNSDPRGRFFEDRNKLRSILWTISMSLVLVLPFSTYPFIQMDQIPSSFLSLVYTGVKRSLWIGGIGWIIYASCTASKNCIVAEVLSAKIFRPFSRLTFCIYLTQSLVVWYYAYQSRELHTISHYNSIFRIGGITLYSLIFGYVLHVLFEAPSVNVCRLLFKRHQQQKQSFKNQKCSMSEKKLEAKENGEPIENNGDVALDDDEMETQMSIAENSELIQHQSSEKKCQKKTELPTNVQQAKHRKQT